jgi:hypothetical protein
MGIVRPRAGVALEKLLDEEDGLPAVGTVGGVGRMDWLEASMR